jgi:CDP-diacylglycerol--glycerol-3-phosphate 3-phosphatidyltransferase
MPGAMDLVCSCAIVLWMLAIAGAYFLHGAPVEIDEDLPSTRATALPETGRRILLWSLRPVGCFLADAGISANAITATSLVVAAIGGLLLGFGHFGAAGVAVTIASLGDALDGLVARRSRSASVAGALFDAAVDRYQEFVLLGGLGMFFRSSAWRLALVLLAIAGSFMVSYGSAKAEALHLPVPSGSMRRAERAVCLGLGTTLVPLAGLLATLGALPAWTTHAPVLGAVLLIGVVSNVSAIRRLRAIARAAAPAQAKASAAPAPAPIATARIARDSAA